LLLRTHPRPILPTGVDIDRFLERNRGAWERLDALVTRARGNPARLSADELRELLALYQRVATHLSLARTYLRDPGLVASLTNTTARAGALIYGTRPRTWAVVGRFFADTFPAAVWYARAFVLIAAALLLVPAAALGTWLANSPAALDVAAPPALREALITEDFEAYYSSAPAAQFATGVTTNNIRVGALAFALGVAACVPTALVLVSNGLNVGAVAGVFAAASEHAKFWGLLIPHGLLELTAVFIAGGAGLRLGWTLIDPGDRRRGEALVEEGRRAFVLVLGVVGAFVVAGLIEGFVTPFLPTWLRVGIGVTVELAFLTYLVVRGRSAVSRGLTGALGEEPLGG
jgi:uncharacterized membrane protein SpoIIM required for sporulation